MLTPILLMHWKCLVPDSVQKASGDALPPHQTEDPDATDATEGFFRHGRAAPGSVALHEILLVHVFGFLWLLQHTKGLENIGLSKISFTLVHLCHSEVKSSGRQRLTCLIFSATRHPTTILSLLMNRYVLAELGLLSVICWKPNSLSAIRLTSSAWNKAAQVRKYWWFSSAEEAFKL